MSEIWTSPDGIACELFYVGGVDDWFPEGPGQRPPARYELRVHGHRDIVVEEHTVFPLEPWSPYDAISDRLIAYGWEPPPSEPEPDCEHGLSANLCHGPNHYPED